MIFLLLAILCSAALPLLFRAFDDWRVNLFWAIPANYFACIVVGVNLRPASAVCDRAIIAAMVHSCDPARICSRRKFLLVGLYRAARGCFGCGSGESVGGGDSGDPRFRPLWRFVERREGRRFGGRAVVALSVYGNRAGFWCYPCVVAPTSADSRVLHVRLSLYLAEIYSGPLSRQFVLSRVRHNVLFPCLCNKRCHWYRENSVLESKFGPAT